MARHSKLNGQSTGPPWMSSNTVQISEQEVVLMEFVQILLYLEQAVEAALMFSQCECMRCCRFQPQCSIHMVSGKDSFPETH